MGICSDSMYVFQTSVNPDLARRLAVYAFLVSCLVEEHLELKHHAIMRISFEALFLVL
ncbi:hypothetical protein [Ottowia thiooxydans]|uniref:hypothetical protein n=1 Tax=Ottowia thiooxydans TaxID=219182 RepID=UPI0012EB3A15|nr:hypothetical protein [Ottowia thiooxydans]